jgi:hypothetical protein
MNITDIVYKIEKELDYIDEAACELTESGADEHAVEDLKKAHQVISECCEALAELSDKIGDML